VVRRNIRLTESKKVESKQPFPIIHPMGHFSVSQI
jgi:hypothetical protein